MNEVRIIPFAGKPLEYEGDQASRTLYTAPERGFVIGPENYALEPVVQWIIEGEIPRERLPILFYGPLGSGRSHLLHGIFQAWRSNRASDPSRSRSYLLPAADFARIYADALATKTTDDFRRRYRKAALLLLDDVDQLHDKPWAQEELQHTLDTLSVEGGTVVLVSTGIPAFSETLTNRLLGGSAIPVFLPGPAVRRRFIREMTSAFRLSLSEKALGDAAEELTVSIPEIYGFFARMRFTAEAENARIDAAYLKRFLKTHNKERRPGIDELAKRAAKHFSLKLSDLKGSSRNKSISRARSVAVYLARHSAGAPIKDIAKYFGNRDPSTIRHLVEKVQSELPDDAELRDHLYRLGVR